MLQNLFIMFKAYKLSFLHSMNHKGLKVRDFTISFSRLKKGAEYTVSLLRLKNS